MAPSISRSDIKLLRIVVGVARPKCPWHLAEMRIRALVTCKHGEYLFNVACWYPQPCFPGEGAGYLSIRLASVVLGICPISCNNPIKKFLYLASANSIVR